MLKITNLKEIKEILCLKYPDKIWVEIDYTEYLHCGFQLSDGSFEIGIFWQKEYEFQTKITSMVKTEVEGEQIDQEVVEFLTQKLVADFDHQPENYKQNINNLILF